MENKYVIPEGMGGYVARAVFNECGKVDFHPQIRVALEAAVRWISENPIVPTLEQAKELYFDKQSVGKFEESETFYPRAWQRRMFLAPEQDEKPIPEINDLLVGTQQCEVPELHRRMRECYRRGQEYAVPVPPQDNDPDPEKARYREALEKLAKLGNGDAYGNSQGNEIAQEALGLDKRPVPPQDGFIPIEEVSHLDPIIETMNRRMAEYADWVQDNLDRCLAGADLLPRLDWDKPGRKVFTYADMVKK